jgi:hypothetical protein
MNPQDQTNLLILALGATAVLIVLVLKWKGMRADAGAQTPPRAHTVTTRIQTIVKLARHPGAKTDFPKLRVMCKGSAMSKLDRVEVKAVRDDGREARADAGVTAGTPIQPEPGEEIDLSAAFHQIATHLCDPFASKTRVKYSVVLPSQSKAERFPSKPLK